MRYTLLFTIAILAFTACKKDKYTTAPQISYKSLSANLIDTNSLTTPYPSITFSITDAEGDLGITANDTAFIYIKSLLTNDFDSVRFPDLQLAAKNNFKADVSVVLPNAVVKCKPIPGGGWHTDQLFFEIYVKDFEKNKSNVITTPDPVYFICR